MVLALRQESCRAAFEEVAVCGSETGPDKETEQQRISERSFLPGCCTCHACDIESGLRWRI